jgi:hypothetical protein
MGECFSLRVIYSRLFCWLVDVVWIVAVFLVASELKGVDG